MSAPDPMPSEDANAQEGGGIEGEAWSAEPGADDFEKEASKIFALWELMPPGEATPSGAESAPETWTADAPHTSAVAPTPAPTPQDAAPTAAAPATVVAVSPAAAAPAEAAAVLVSGTVSKARDENAARASGPRAVRAAPQPADITDRNAAMPAEAPIELPRRSMAPLALVAVALIGIVSVGAFIFSGGSGRPPRTAAPGPVAAVAAVATTLPAVAAVPPVAVLAGAAPTVAPPPVEAALPVVAPEPLALPEPSMPAVVPEPPPAVPPPVERHTLRVSVRPDSSLLTLDGAPFAAPYRAELEAGTVHVIVASADGFESATRQVTLAGDERISLSLERTPAVASAPATSRRGRRGSRLGSRIGSGGSSSSGGSSGSSGGSRAGGSSGGTGTFVSESPY